MQEVTENIYALLSAKGWWRRYVASPIPYDRPYFTALLHLRDGVHNAQPVRLRDFSNSAMGAPLCAADRRGTGARRRAPSPGPGTKQKVKQALLLCVGSAQHVMVE